MNSEPQLNDGATIYMHTDRRACTVISITASGKTVTIQEDTATLLNGPDSNAPDKLQWHPGGFAGHMTGTPRYAITRDPNGRIHTARKRRDGNYHCGIGQVKFGIRHHYYDFNF